MAPETSRKTIKEKSCSMRYSLHLPATLNQISIQTVINA